MTDPKLPKPPYPANTDVSRIPFFPLLIDRLLGSRLWLLGSGDTCKAALTIWCRAWQECPAGSIPAGPDDLHRRLAGVESSALWEKIRAEVLGGFEKHSDERLYHPVLTAQVKYVCDGREKGRSLAAIRWKNKRKPDAARIAAPQSGAALQPRNSTELTELTELTEEESSPSLPPQEPQDQRIHALAVALLAKVEAAIDRAYGCDARPWPASSDLQTAREWLSIGLTEQAIADTVHEVSRRLAEKGEEPPTSLRYFTLALARVAKGNGAAPPAPATGYGSGSKETGDFDQDEVRARVVAERSATEIITKGVNH